MEDGYLFVEASPVTRFGPGPARLRGPHPPGCARNVSAKLAAAQQVGADTESVRLCGAKPRTALRTNAISNPPDHPSHAIRSDVDNVTRGSVTVTPPRSKSVVITGASSGLGRAAAIRLSELGYRVFAGVRTESSATELSLVPSSAGELMPVILDVTDTASIAQAGQLVEHGCSDTGLWAVVNNAGISISSPLECVPMDVLRTQLETNVVGVLAVSQRFLPLLRACGGRIVNVSSGIGNVAPPYLGAYAAAQFAKEGMSDSFRRELRPLGVSVSVIQPGVVLHRSGARCADPRTRSWLRLPPRSSRLTAPDSLHL